MTDQNEALGAQEPVASPLSAPAGYGFPKDAEGLLAWAHAEQLLEQAHSYWLATTSPDGRPHVTPLWAPGSMARSTSTAIHAPAGRATSRPIPTSASIWRAARMW